MIHFIFRKKNKGVALVLILVVFAVIAIIGTTMLSISVNQARQTSHGVYYDQAYYLARSAVDVVAKDIEDRVNNLQTLKNNLDGAKTLAAFDGYDTAYKNEVNFLNNNILGHTVTLSNANGYVANQAVITLQGGNIYVESTMTVNGVTAVAKTNLASFTNTNSTLTIDGNTTSSMANSIFYTWNDITIGSNGDIVGDLNYSGTISIGTNMNNHGSTPSHVTSQSYSYLQTPSVWNEGMPAPTRKVEDNLVRVDYAGTNLDVISISGYYNATYSGGFNWIVDTRDHDVELVFNSLTAEQASSIKVLGSNDLYIYLVQDGSSPVLMNMKNNFTISNYDGTIVPHTYIVSCDKKMRSATHTGDNTQVEINNGLELHAFFYLPYTDFTVIKNNFTLYGCLYANSLNIKNNTVARLIPPTDLNFGANNESSYPVEPTKISLNYLSNDFTIDKTWIK